MSYLMLPDGIPPISQAVISLWFRVPQASLDAARGQALPDNAEGDINQYFPAFSKTIPLVSFGSIETAITDKGYGTSAYPTAPSFIGVDCTGTSYGLGKNTLAVHLAMPNNSTFVMTPMDSDGRDSTGEPQFIDALGRKDSFYMSGIGSDPYSGAEPSILEVTADKWHHVLLSFDLTIPAVMNYSTAPAPGVAPITMQLGGPTFMWAFDDEDKTDFSLSPSSAQIYNILPPGSTFVPAPEVPLKQITTNNLITIAAGAWAFIGTWEPVPIQAQGNPVGLPTSAMFVDSIYRVEMAELQFFTGITVDTSDSDIRRLFVDDEGKPVLPETAESSLGKKPEILLHGSGNWIRGTNTGIGAAVPLTPTGKIVGYPGPRLGT